MKSSSPEGEAILKDHEQVKAALARVFSKNPIKLTDEVEKLCFLTFRKFRNIQQFPYYDFMENEEK